MPHIFKAVCFIFLCLFGGQLAAEEKKVIIRVGHFPNVTHAQALVAHQLSRQNKGWFEERLGPDVEIQWYVYNAGPSAMEAILADSIDLTYVGPSPTINAYVKSKGEIIRVISGSCSGGAALVVQSDDRIKTDADFKGKKIATPQFGNTQDVACRSWLESIGLEITQTGGDAFVIPTENSDQINLFKTGELDGSWTIEPWVSRLTLTANGKIYLEESRLWPQTNGKYVTTHLASSQKFLKEQPELAKKWVQAHVELTEWINNNPDEAKKLFLQELKEETTVTISQELLNSAWSRIELTHDPIPISLQKYAEDAYRIGFLKAKPDVKGIYDLQYLNDYLKEKKQAPIEGL